MEKIKIKLWVHKILKILKWAFLVLVGLFIILVIGRGIYRVNEAKTDEQVIKIHNTKLTMDDVMGTNLPPDPGALADATVEGIDANNNGIRDDVERAIFKEYPNSAKTRAVLLQYALVLQMEVVQPMVNTKTATEVITEESRTHTCVGDVLVPRKSLESDRNNEEVDKIYTYINFIENKQLNTDMRKNAHNNFLKYMRSFGESTNKICDIDVSKLPN